MDQKNEWDHKAMITLKRIAHTDDGTFGVLLLEGSPFAVTLERPWLDNQRGKSCIPTGVYLAMRCRTSATYGHQDSPKFGNTFVVPQRQSRR